MLGLDIRVKSWELIPRQDMTVAHINRATNVTYEKKPTQDKAK